MKGIQLAAILICVSCTSAGNSPLAGRWKFDLATLKMPGLTDEMRNSPGFAKDMSSNALDLRQDGSCSFSGATNLSGKWKLEGNVVSIKSDQAHQSGDIPVITANEARTRLHASLPQQGFEVDLVRQDP